MLKELFWLLANLLSKESIAIAFTNDGLAEHVQLIAQSYGKQYSFEMWKLTVWILRSTAVTQREFEEHSIDVSPHFRFLLDSHEIIHKLIFTDLT